MNTNGRAMKVRGAAFERDVVRVLRAYGHPYAERSYGAGRPDDVGDIDGIPWAAIEVKAHRTLDLAGFMDEAVAEAANAGDVVPVVVAKRRNRPTEDAYVVMRLVDWALMVAAPSPPGHATAAGDGTCTQTAPPAAASAGAGGPLPGGSSTASPGTTDNKEGNDENDCR